MTSYIIKRILLMVPTLFLVLLVSFGVLNMVPGSPAQTSMGSQGTESSSSQESRESYRIFKEQFNLDKPIFFNTRTGLEKKDVVEKLEIIARAARPACPTGDKPAPEDCLPAAQKPKSGQVINARTGLADWGAYVVPELVEVAKNHPDRDLRVLALQQLPTNAKGRMINQYGESLTEAQQKHNERVFQMNSRIESWTVGDEANKAEIEKMVTENWEPWIEEHKDRFQYSASEKVGIFFGDTRFAKYLGNLATFDFGVSHVDKQPVFGTIIEKVRYTIAMTFSAMILAFLISVPIGVWSAYNQHSWVDQAVTIILLMLFSLPTFFTGVILLKFFATGDPFNWFPISGYAGDNTDQMSTLTYFQSVAWHLILPVFCLTYRRFAALSRYARTGIVDVIRSDYIRTARAKGLSESMVVIKHAVRNGMIPILTLLGTQLPRLVGGSIVIEVVFGIPGMGSYLLDSIFARDYNALMGVLLVSAVLTMVGILISDISYAIVDPRISFD